MEEFRPAQVSTPMVFGAPPSPPDLEQSVATFTNRGGGLAVLLSDLLSPTWEKALTRLGSRASEVVVLHLLSPQELRPYSHIRPLPFQW